MQDEIYSIFHLSIEPENFQAFKSLIGKIVSATKAEPDTLTYEYVVNTEHSQVQILEHYRTAGVLPHIEKTFAPFAAEFLSLAKIEKLFVYGATTPEIRVKLNEFGAQYFESLDGFAR